MALAERVRVARRFQRAVRIDTDLADPAALDGFICPSSSADILKTLARHVADSGQGAFTWTGPYGSGKSSLAVAFSALLNRKARLRKAAAAILGQSTATAVWDALPYRTRGWHILPVVGRRARPAQLIGEALEASGLLSARKRGRQAVSFEAPQSWEEDRVLASLGDIAQQNPRTAGGLLVFIDEMGKFLEAAAGDGTDIYFFQQLAELASRSKRRLILVGILHQAFEEYAHRLARDMRDEWAKIQGRFVDLAVNVSGDEQIDLLARAIESDHKANKPGALAAEVAALTPRQRSPHLARMLEDCWPLHPIVACLLGPVSRRRFGQNQRSIFGFLNSAEPQGFQDFLHADDRELYSPDRLWDYLRLNLEPSIMASPDGHRWALAVDALERCEVMGGEELHLRLLKTIALADLLKDRSGLAPGPALLHAALPAHKPQEITQALEDLRNWRLIIFRKFSDAYGVFEGSDFDIDRALERALAALGDIDFARLGVLAGFHPIVAKRHYHETGALRWFNMEILPLAELEQAAASYAPQPGAIGAFFLAIPTQGELAEEIETVL